MQQYSSLNPGNHFCLNTKPSYKDPLYLLVTIFLVDLFSKRIIVYLVSNSKSNSPDGDL